MYVCVKCVYDSGLYLGVYFSLFLKRKAARNSIGSGGLKKDRRFEFKNIMA